MSGNSTISSMKGSVDEHDLSRHVKEENAGKHSAQHSMNILTEISTSSTNKPPKRYFSIGKRSNHFDRSMLLRRYEFV